MKQQLVRKIIQSYLLVTRRTSRYLAVGAALLALGLILAACNSTTPAGASNARGSNQATAMPSAYVGKKVFYIDSYHQGYAWSDGVLAGLKTVFNNTGIELKLAYMDTKRNPDVNFARSAGEQVKTQIDAFKPDVVIASDDNAQKYVIVPYYKNSNLPVVFDGVNWDASIYGYPTSNVTGMLEVDPVAQIVNYLKTYAKGDRLGFLSIDSETERKTADIYNQRFFNGQMTLYWAKTQDEFKQAFLRAQTEVDMLFISNNAGSDRWEEAAMTQFILDNSKIPSGAIYDWMVPYALVTLAKSPDEQGEWAAQATLRILDGTPVSNIPVAENKKGKLILNLDLADKLDVVFAPSLLKNAEVYPAGN